MAPEDAAIGMQFVEHNVAKVFEQTSPARVMRQDSGVQHIWIGEHNVAALANRHARVRRRVTVISKDAETVVE